MRMHTKLCWDFRSPPPVKSNPPSIGNKRLKLRWLFWCLFPSIQGSISPWLILILLTLSSKHILSPPERYWLNPLPEKKKKRRYCKIIAHAIKGAREFNPRAFEPFEPLWFIWAALEECPLSCPCWKHPSCGPTRACFPCDQGDVAVGERVWLQVTCSASGKSRSAAFSDNPHGDGLSQLWNHSVSLPFFTLSLASPKHKTPNLY